MEITDVGKSVIFGRDGTKGYDHYWKIVDYNETFSTLMLDDLYTRRVTFGHCETLRDLEANSKHQIDLHFTKGFTDREKSVIIPFEHAYIWIPSLINLGYRIVHGIATHENEIGHLEILESQRRDRVLMWFSDLDTMKQHRANMGRSYWTSSQSPSKNAKHYAWRIHAGENVNGYAGHPQEFRPCICVMNDQIDDLIHFTKSLKEIRGLGPDNTSIKDSFDDTIENLFDDE